MIIKAPQVVSRIAGTSQADRWNGPLHHDHVKIDERDLPDLLSFLREYAKHIKYYGKENTPQGNWQPFLDSDLSVLLARILITNPEDIDKGYNKKLKAFEDEMEEWESRRLLGELFHYVFNLIRRVDDSYKSANQYLIEAQDNELGDLVQHVIDQKMADKFQDFKQLVHHCIELRILSFDLESLDQLESIWDRGEVSGEIDLNEPNTMDTLAKAGKSLTFLFKGFLRNVSLIVHSSEELFKKSLHHEHHAPQNALLIAFLMLYQHLKEDMNGLTQKHLDYYYFDRLQQQFRKSIPDQVHLNFVLNDHVDHHVIEKGTLFKAGTDEEGHMHLYESEQELSLSKAFITDVKTLYLSTHPSIVNLDKYRLIANIYQSKIASEDDPLTTFNKNNYSFATFGEDVYRKGEAADAAEIGFAITSPVLMLREGYRNLVLSFKFNLRSMTSLVSFLEDFHKDQDLTPDTAFNRIFANAFDIHLSTEEGWFMVEDYQVAPKEDWADATFKFFLDLDITAPPILPLPEDHEDHASFQAQWPIIKVTLNTTKSMYAYSYLRDLQIEECKVEVDVKDIKDVQAFNDIGKLDVSMPFYPFGTTPGIGSYLLVGYNELFIKQLESLSCTIDWHNLPRLENGFEAYYKRYEEEITNDSFEVSLRALNNSRFFPQIPKNLQKFHLFETKKVEKGKANLKTLDTSKVLDQIDLDVLQIAPDYTMEELPDYDNNTRAGYLKLEVEGPEMGFGHDKYPTLFAKAAMEGAAKKELAELPNVPFAPQIRSLKLNYQASTKLYLNKNSTMRGDPAAEEKYYHIHPFGVRTTLKNAVPEIDHLLPHFAYDGDLILGFKALPQNETITIYFELEKRVENRINVQRPVVVWQYLVNDEWQDFKKNEVIFDSTNGFTVSGIVKLFIPSLISTENHILPSGKYWISAKIRGDVNLISRTKSIYPHAVTAAWTPPKEGSEWSTHIPPETIRGFLTPQSEVASVSQVARSFSGVPKENRRRFYARVSETLRHKNKAVAPWDYEHLVLEKFPFLSHVKCITPIESKDTLEAGEVMVVVVPGIVKNEHFYLPRCNYNTLDEIRNFLEPLVSPFVRLNVTNPVYEWVKISCKLQFRDKMRKGEYISQLNEDVRKFLCPWFYDSSSEMQFGSSISHEEIYTFLESLDYITFMTSFSVIIVHDDEEKYALSDSTQLANNRQLESSKPWSVLVPMDSHHVMVLDQAIHETSRKAAIENMQLGQDFVVTAETVSEEEDASDDDNDDYFVVEIDLIP